MNSLSLLQNYYLFSNFDAKLNSENMAKTSKKGGGKGVTPTSLSVNVLPCIPFILSLLPLKHHYSLSSSVFFMLPVIASFGSVGVAPTRLSRLLHGNTNGYRSVCSRLNTLKSKGLVVNSGGKWRLSGEGVRALSSVVVEGESANFLREVERKKLRAEKLRAKKLAKLRDAGA